MSKTYREFDAADYVKTKQNVQGILKAAADEDFGDEEVILTTLKHVIQARNMNFLTCNTRRNRSDLYKALSEDGNPILATLLKVTHALGLRLRLEPVANSAQNVHPIKQRQE